MADIEVVIKIPEDEYNIAKYGQYGNINVDIVRKALANGAPLPKGHGDLIDRNDLLEYTDINECAYIPTINRYDIITTPTIIKSDKEAQDADSD